MLACFLSFLAVPGLSPAAVRGCSRCGVWAPERRLRGCSSGAQGPAARGIFLDQGPNPSPRLGQWLLNSWILREARRRLLSAPASGSSLSSTSGSLGKSKYHRVNLIINIWVPRGRFGCLSGIGPSGLEEPLIPTLDSE